MGEIIFIDQRFEVFQRPVTFRARQRRRQVIDDDGGVAPLGLRPLARIVDDKGIDVWQRTQHRFRGARRRKCQRLAGQPFQIAMLAIVQHGMGAKNFAQPNVKCEIAVRGYQRRVVIGFFRVDIVAARRLHRDRHISVYPHGEMEGAIAHKGIVLRYAPAGFHFGPQLFRQFCEVRAILRQCELCVRFLVRPSAVGGAFEQLMDKRRSVLRETAHLIAFASKRG